MWKGRAGAGTVVPISWMGKLEAFDVCMDAPVATEKEVIQIVIGKLECDPEFEDSCF